jgi:DNA mismatch repair protein MutS
LGEGQFIENDALLDQEDNQLLIITGPNMAGKSTYIRQVALTVLMAQMGSFVPAGYAHIGLIDKIFTRIGASDNLARGESTFMVEMIETANILNNASPKSLVILDEIGRGTSTYDGVSIAWAVGEFLNRSEGPRPKTLFATHFHELTELEHSLKGVKNYHITAREVGEEIVFIRKIVPGGADRSYGIHVGKLAGLPKEVVERAQEILSYLEEEKISEEALAKKLRKKGKTASLKALPLFKDLEGEDVAQNISHKRVSRAVSEQSVRMITHPVVKELGELAIDEMTPLEALNRLQQLKEKITSSSSSGSPQGL